MRLALVVPRYGPQVVGGAEAGARMLAEGLAARGWRVEALTTCARDLTTWEDVDPPGETVEGGVRVRRWRSVAGRSSDFDRASEPVFEAPGGLTRDEALAWVDLQGPVCPQLVDAAAASDADIVVFSPYLYYPTVRGVPRLGPRAVLQPAAHDEAPLRLAVFPEVFEAPGGLVFYTGAERDLVNRSFRVASRPQVVVGLGVDPRVRDPVAEPDPLGLEGRPYVCCVGRVHPTKGTTQVAEWFAAYKARHPGPLALVLVGPVGTPPPAHPDVVVTGPLEEEAKRAVLQGALALVSPSVMESFSLVVLEAWAAGVPVVVNGHCAPTREHCERSGGGLWFEGYAHFEVILDRLQAEPGLRRALAAAGGAYVERYFRWPVVLDRYQAFLARVAARAAA
ncbi:MAG TPA: glycosyltransferase family 4 protein [Acidimicrobiales bacterium]|jgi:glycosyltransferase involved in cell wall biosynthesis|nr:glycosyltransferase family 4 protein [Acidimicrobiales bacterium]